MRHDDHIGRMIGKIPRQHRRHFAVDQIHRRAPWQTAIEIAQLIGKSEHSRRTLRYFDICLINIVSQTLTFQRIRIEHLRMMSAPRQRLADGGTSRVVPAAGTA